MNVNEYCKRYRKDKRDVESALAKGRVRGVRIIDGVIDIPEDAKIDYYIKKSRKNITRSDVRVYIIKALHGFWYIDAELVGISQLDYECVVDELVRCGYIERVGQCDGITTTGLSLTITGESCAKKSNRELAQFLIESVSAGAMRGTLEFADSKRYMP